MIRIFVYNVITLFAVKGKPMRRLFPAEPPELYRWIIRATHFPQRFVSFSYTRDLLIWSLAQLLLFVSLHTHPKSDSDVCTYNQSPLCLSVVIATNIFPFKDMCVVFSSVNGLQLWRHENYQMSSPTRFKKVSPVSQFAKASYNLSPGGQSQPTPTHSSSCTITWMNRWLI